MSAVIPRRWSRLPSRRSASSSSSAVSGWSGTREEVGRDEHAVAAERRRALGQRRGLDGREVGREPPAAQEALLAVRPARGGQVVVVGQVLGQGGDERVPPRGPRRGGGGAA